MKLSDLELYLVELARGRGAPPLRSLVIMLATDAGRQGWGECESGWRADEVPARRDALWRLLAGRSVFDIAELASLEDLEDTPLAAAVEMASWDLVGRIAEQPLCHLWGGVYRPRVPLAARVPASEPASAARELADHGFHAQIVTAAGTVEIDLAAAHSVLEAVGGRSQILLDGRGLYSLREALRLGQALGEDGIHALLDPLAPRESAGMASLARQVMVPLWQGREVRGPRDVLAAARGGSAAGVMIDPRRVGGLAPTRKCAAVAEAARMDMALFAEGSAGPALAAALQLAAATPAIGGPSASDHDRLADDLLTDPLEIVEGMIAVPQAPGLGVEIDRGKLERYQLT